MIESSFCIIAQYHYLAKKSNIPVIWFLHCFWNFIWFVITLGQFSRVRNSHHAHFLSHLSRNVSLYIVNILYSKGPSSVRCRRTFSTLSKWKISKTSFGQNVFVTSLGWPKRFHGNQNINSYRLIMGKIFSTRLELFFFFIRSSSNLSVTKTGVSLGRVRFSDKPDYSFGCYLPLFFRRLIPYTYYGGSVVELSGYEGRDKVSYDNDFGAKLD